MYPANFDYYRATTVAEAVNLLNEHEDAKLLAGGHSLIPTMKLRLAEPSALIDIGRIDTLTGVTQSNGTVRIGALTTHHEIATSAVVQASCSALAEAASQVGDPAVRHKGTLGGNLAHADPASDPPAAVLALGGTIVLTGPNGERQVSANDFFVDLLETALQEDEILTAVELPALNGKSGSAYLKVAHPASGYAICGAVAIITLADDGICQRASLCFNGVTATPHQASAVTDKLVGQTLNEAIITEALATLSMDEPMGDVQASGAYRVQLAKVYGKRALLLALERAQGNF